jgi:hypothetical protein
MPPCLCGTGSYLIRCRLRAVSEDGDDAPQMLDELGAGLLDWVPRVPSLTRIVSLVISLRFRIQDPQRI